MIYIFSITRREIVQTGNSREECRPVLTSLRENDPDALYGMGEYESEKACFEYIDVAIKRHRRDALALASLPEVTGPDSITQKEWDASMLLLSKENRGFAANLAAHSWAAIPHADGLVVVGWKQSYLLTGNDKTVVETPPICHSCVYSEKLDRNNPRVCRYGEKETTYVGLTILGDPYERCGSSRHVGENTTCSAWKSK